MERTAMNIKSSKDWVLQVEQSLTQEQPDSSIECYPRLPKPLRNKNTEVFYTPQVISFGPYHFHMKKPICDEVEVLKSEFATKFHVLLKDGLSNVMMRLMGEETKIRQIYAKAFPSFLSRKPKVLAWMMTRDACLLLAILYTFSKEEEKERKENSSEGKKKIPSLSIYHPLLNDIVKDMFKMENQLPLWVLDEIRSPLGRCEDDCFESALRNLSPIEVSKEDGNRHQYDPESHILYLLHEYIVDPPPPTQPFSSPGQARPSSSSSSSTSSLSPPHPLRGQARPFLPPRDGSLISYIGRALWIRTKRAVASLLYIGAVAAYVLILVLLSPLIVIWLTWLIVQECYYKEEEEKNHVPTLEELRRIGVKFRKLDGGGISHIKFEESSRTLHLPKFKVDDRSEVILRNLMAREICSEEEEKPITRYAIFMNDLVNTSEDVAILRRDNIITSKLGSDEDVARLWNSIVIATEMPMYEPINKTATNINAYRGKWWKVLWAQFKMVHCSKPWLVVSLLGGTSLLPFNSCASCLLIPLMSN